MRRRDLGGVAAALVVGLGVAVATARAGDYYDDGTPEPKGLLSGMFNEKPKSQAKPNKKAKTTKNVQNNAEQKNLLPAPSAETSTVEREEVERQRRENALLRRMAVCDRLRMIANQTGNETLMTQANELEERANAVYRQQMAGLSLPAQTPLSILAENGRGQVVPPLPGERSPANRGQYGLGPDRIQSEPRPMGSGGMGGN